MTIVAGVTLFRSRDELIDDIEDAFRARIPDIYWGEEGIARIISEVFAGVLESVFMANAILADDMFVQTASEGALDRRGDEYGVPRLPGTPSTGSVTFSGDGGTPIPIGTEIAYDPGTGGDYLYFLTTGAGTIPFPGTPIAPVAGVGAAGLLTGSYEYRISFVTAGGETLAGAESNAVTLSAQQGALTAIPLGGAGTTARKIYRQKNGGDYHYVATLADNTTTVYNDNIADATVAAAPVPVSISTAEKVTVTAQSEESGADYNVAPLSITVLTNAPDGVTDVTNSAPFSGATDPEGFEDYRDRLLSVLRAPQTGSAADLKNWAEEVAGVGSATVFPNDNNGTPTNGYVTVRISAPDGSVPSSTVRDEVLAALQAKDLANVTIVVGTFSPVTTNVGVTITPASGYSVADLTPAVQAAISDYITNLDVGETLRVAGISAAVFVIGGIVDVVVTTPGSNQATGATSKRVPGTITVS